MIDLQTLEVVNSFLAPGGPDCMDVSRDLSQIMVTSRWSRKLGFIDVASRKMTPQINVGRSPMASGRSTTHHASQTSIAIYLIATCAYAEKAKALFDTKNAAAGGSCKPVFLMRDTGHMKVAPLMADVPAGVRDQVEKHRTADATGRNSGWD